MTLFASYFNPRSFISETISLTFWTLNNILPFPQSVFCNFFLDKLFLFKCKKRHFLDFFVAPWNFISFVFPPNNYHVTPQTKRGFKTSWKGQIMLFLPSFTRFIVYCVKESGKTGWPQLIRPKMSFILVKWLNNQTSISQGVVIKGKHIWLFRQMDSNIEIIICFIKI